MKSRSHLDGSTVEWAGRRKPKLKALRPPPTPVVVDGRECFSVPLTKGQSAIIDKSDLHLVSGFNWYAFKHKHGFYAARKFNHGEVTAFMQNILMPPSPSLQIDHINGNGLDNRRKNLRVGTVSQNHANSQKQFRNTSSKFKGIHWLKRERRWRAKIQFDYKEINLGYFKNEGDAAQAYKTASQQLYGEFAVHNRSTINQENI